MTASHLLSDLQSKGIAVSLRGDKLRLEPKEALTPDVLTTVREHKASLIAYLSVPRLPWQLERLVSAASSHVLNFTMPHVGNVNHHTAAWACAYLTGDRGEAIKRLWEVYAAWQQDKN